MSASAILRSPKSPVQLLSLAALLAFVLTISNVSWATSCTTISLTLGGPPVTCTIPEKTPELTLTTTLSGLSFTDQAQGMVLIYDNAAHTILSDVVTFTNVNGIATVAFLSDTDLSTITASGLPILGQFTEGKKPIFISVALGNGDFISAKICSDVNEKKGCKHSSDSISLAERSTVVPEPGTLILFGTGLIGSGAMRLRFKRWRRPLRSTET